MYLCLIHVRSALSIGPFAELRGGPQQWHRGWEGLSLNISVNQNPSQTPGRASSLKGTIYSAISIGPILLADEPISPKKPKSVPEPNPRVMEVEATSPWPSEWTSVRIGPGEETVGQDVLAVRVLVTSEDSRYARLLKDGGSNGGGAGCIWIGFSLH